MKKFIVLTTGRTGSTSLMKILEGFKDVALPNSHHPSEDNELFNPVHIDRVVDFYATNLGRTISSGFQLVNAFFEISKDYAFAGFKTMPHRHEMRGIQSSNPDLQFITMHRRDLLSSVASYVAATIFEDWRREGGVQSNRIQMSPEVRELVVLYTTRIVEGERQMLEMEGTIKLYYEDIIAPDFKNDQLDKFFGRPIRLARPKKAVSAKSYIDDWEQFSRLVQQAREAVTSVQVP